MAWILVSKHIQSILVFQLFYLTVSGQISASWAMIDEVVLGEEALGTSIVSSGKMNLCKEESII